MNTRFTNDEFEMRGPGGRGGHGGRGRGARGGHGGWGGRPDDGRGPRGPRPEGRGAQGFDAAPEDFAGRGEGRGRGRGFGGPRPDGRGQGPWSEMGGRGPRRGPGRGRKGDVRNAILALLQEQPLNGYGLIGAISEKTQGLWSPSAGSIYPALGLLEDEGLIEPTEVDGKKVHQLTAAGKAHVAEHADELSNPWERVSNPHKGFLDVRKDMAQLGMAVEQVVIAGDQAQLEKVKQILANARKDVYRLLAGDLDD